jgi:chemotaxis protein CheZ
MPNKVYKRDQVVGIINSVLGKIHKPEHVSHDALSHELVELKKIIENLRNQLHAAQPADIGQTYIPNAKDELDAIIGATENATHTIMESCEHILEAMKPATPELSQQVENLIVKIFEACTFQDITGQRIKKVTTSLKQIDTKISSVLAALEGELTETGNTETGSAEKVVNLLNGPALPQNSVSQDDIDKLLAEFDNGNLQG